MLHENKSLRRRLLTILSPFFRFYHHEQPNISQVHAQLTRLVPKGRLFRHRKTASGLQRFEIDDPRMIFAIIAVLISVVVYFLLKPRKLRSVRPLEEKWWGEGVRKNESEEIKPFKYEASDEELDDLKNRLRKTRYFQSLEDAGWKYGARPDFMKKVVKYWVDEFSWRKQEQIINGFQHFKTDIDGISLHFIHAKPKSVSPGTKVLPILLIHGWPGSFFEFYKVIPLLTQEQNGFVFEVIVPSLPGYGFSSPARKVGMAAEYIALIMDKLMRRLEFSTYYIQGGDWGSTICRAMAVLYSSNVKGVHMNFWPLFTHPKYPILTHVIGAVMPSLVVANKQERSKVFPAWTKFKEVLGATGYFHIQATKPDTVGFGLNDSPAGLASYVLEKFIAATRSEVPDAIESMEKRLTLDEVLTDIMIYWLTSSMPSAMRLYKEGVNSKHNYLQRYPISIPAAFAEFPEEAFPPPRSWIKASCKNLVSYTVMKKGGHFAAFEQPVAFADDVRKFVEKVETS